MSDTIHIRASAAPLAFLCPGSVRAGDVEIRERSEPADLGSAAHEALRPLAEVGAVDWGELPSVAAHWGVDEIELRVVVAGALKLWPHVAESFARAMTEVPFRHDAERWSLSGHVDLLANGEESARLADWKTGRKDHDYSHQMRAYGVLALLDDPRLQEVTVTILWTRDGEIENYTLRRADVKRWIHELEASVVDWDGTYHPGPHCRHCPRSHECSAANALARRDMASLLDTGLADALTVARLSPGEQVELFRKAAMAVAIGERVRAAIRTHVELHGEIATDATRLTLETEERREIDTLKAWPVLERAGFGDAEFAQTVAVRISRVESLVAKRAGFGKGASAVRALNGELDEAGAVRPKEVRKLVEKRRTT
jgi:hypothetical protein